MSYLNLLTILLGISLLFGALCANVGETPA